MTFFVLARAAPVPKESAAPSVATETIAVKVLVAEIVDIASPSCGFPRGSKSFKWAAGPWIAALLLL